VPTRSPSRVPTKSPSRPPTISPTRKPTVLPTISPLGVFVNPPVSPFEETSYPIALHQLVVVPSSGNALISLSFYDDANDNVSLSTFAF
jgi:hypothetical protein